MIELLDKKITVEEFQAMEFPENDFFIYELINGIIMKKAAPKPRHQLVSRRLTHAFENYLETQAIGHIFYAPIDVFFDKYSQAQPDILFIKNDRDFIIDLDDGIMGAPDLLVEIISPGSYRMDRVDKKDLYEKFAVKEYWIIDPNNQVVEVYLMDNNAYTLNQILEVEGIITSTVLEGFELNIQKIFE
jgi:Uma2 family endonuclease